MEKNKREAKRPQLDFPFSYYRDLVARSFLAHLVIEAEKGSPADESHFRNLYHDYCKVLELLASIEEEELWGIWDKLERQEKERKR